MKNLLVPSLIAVLLLAGCASKKAMNEQATPEVATDPKPAEVTEPKTTPEPVEKQVASEPEPQVEQAATKIFFDFDSYRLTQASKEALKGNARWLKAQEEVRIVIEGHTDERGSNSYNLALGEKRAQAALDYLLNLGIAPERIKIVSYGEEEATQGANSEVAWAKDRRAEFVKAN